MSFLHPLALLGLAAAAIPALLHLLQRRTPPELEFPPLRYLSEAERQSARRLKLRHLLLLLLRTALIVGTGPKALQFADFLEAQVFDIAGDANG